MFLDKKGLLDIPLMIADNLSTMFSTPNNYQQQQNYEYYEPRNQNGGGRRIVNGVLY